VAYGRELRSRLVNRLLQAPRRHGDVSAVAHAVGMSRRTLHAWLRARGRPSARRVGRPGATDPERFAALRAVACLARIGWRITWRSVKEALRGTIRTRLIQWAVARWKELRAWHAERHRRRVRVQTTVHAPAVVWGLDGTHVGRTIDGKALESQTLRDHASRLTVDVAVSTSASGDELVQLLEHARQTIGELSLVLVTDNAPNNTSEDVERYLAEHQVIHLLTLPYTPQHNAPTERAHRELKELAGLGKGVVLDGPHDAARRLESARHHLDHRHARPVLGGRTAADAYRDRAARATIPDRGLFYRTTQHALDVASQQPTAHQRRRARREAIYASLERFGLITRTRGGVPFTAVM